MEGVRGLFEDRPLSIVALFGKDKKKREDEGICVYERVGSFSKLFTSGH